MSIMTEHLLSKFCYLLTHLFGGIVHRAVWIVTVCTDNGFITSPHDCSSCGSIGFGSVVSPRLVFAFSFSVSTSHSTKFGGFRMNLCIKDTRAKLNKCDGTSRCRNYQFGIANPIRRLIDLYI